MKPSFSPILLSSSFLLVFLFLWLTPMNSGFGKLPPEVIPQQIDFSHFPATSVQEVLIPLPSEIFSVLDGLGNPKWKDFLLLGDKIRTPESRPHVALLLGSVIAEGFLAVEVEDTERVKTLGKEVLTLAGAIGVRDSVIARSKSIIEKADHHDWRGVRSEFDGAQNDVRTAMTEMDDQGLAQLVSLGGWLRGTDVLTTVIEENKMTSAIELLHQPDLVRHFEVTIKTISPRLRKNNLVKKTDKVLTQIAPLLKGSPESIDLENVHKIRAATHDLILQIDELSSKD